MSRRLLSLVVIAVAASLLLNATAAVVAGTVLLGPSSLVAALMPGPLFDQCDPDGAITKAFLADPILGLNLPDGFRTGFSVMPPHKSFLYSQCDTGQIQVNYSGNLDRVYDELKARIPASGWKPTGENNDRSSVSYTHITRSSYFSKFVVRRSSSASIDRFIDSTYTPAQVILFVDIPSVHS